MQLFIFGASALGSALCVNYTPERRCTISHVVSLSLEIRSLKALKEAVEAMGGQYLQHETKWRWYGSWQNDYHGADAAYKQGIPASRYGTSDAGVIRFPGCQYDVGVFAVPGKPGAYTLVYDNWSGGRGIEALCGAGLPKLKQQYAAKVAGGKLNALRMQGFRVQQRVLPNGTIQLVASK